MPFQATHVPEIGVEVQVWQVMPADDRILAVLDDAERVRAERYRRREDRDRFATARFALRLALARRLGTTPGRFSIGIDAAGRPYCRAAPDFSISHSGDLVLVAIADMPGLKVGADIEREVRDADFDALIRRACSTPERAWIEAARSGRRGRFFDMWTRKEAALKCKGLGLGVEPQLASYDPGAGLVRFAKSLGLAPARVAPIRIGDGYKAAVAVDCDDVPPAAIAWSAGLPH